MTLPDSVGASEWTPLKQKHFASIVGMHLSIAKAVIRKHDFYKREYCYIDATAGPGTYPLDNALLEGSPLVFIHKAEEIQMAYCAHLIENVKENLRQLTACLPAVRFGVIDPRPGDYADVIAEILGGEDENQLGLVYVDPSSGIPDFDALTNVSRLRPRMELLLYLSATNLKRVHRFTDQHLSTCIAMLNKTHWLVRKPAKGDRHQWTFLLGSNSDLFKDYRRIEFYALDSTEAQEFFPKLELSRAQMRDRLQPRLFN